MLRNRLRLFVPSALAALVLLGGCTRGDRPPAADEAGEPEYQRGRQLEQDRPQEALVAYLKVIARRGEDNAAESHLGAGVIYLRHVKDPIEAIHHFREYLKLQPNSGRADFVRQQIDVAKRDFDRTLHAQPLESVANRLELQEQIARLQRENDQLKAELAQRSETPLPRATSKPGEVVSLAPLSSLPDNSPVTLVPLSAGSSGKSTPGTSLAPPKTAVPRLGTGKAAAAPAGRRHTVATKDSLWSIARKYYGTTAANADVERIRQANRDVLSDGDTLKLGMELKIP